MIQGNIEELSYQRLSEQGITNHKQCVYGQDREGSVSEKDDKQISDASGKLASEAVCLSEISPNPRVLHFGKPEEELVIAL